MQTETLKNYIDYFRTWADDDADVRFFVFGGVEKGLEFARGYEGFDYPFVWLEQPTILTDDNDMANLNEMSVSGISVLCLAEQDNLESQIDAYDKALRILCRIQKKMNQDTRQGDIIADLSKMKKAIIQLWLDSHCG